MIPTDRAVSRFVTVAGREYPRRVPTPGGGGLRTGRPYQVCAEVWPSETRRQILKQP